MAEKIHRNSLKPGYRLHWYEIARVLGQGGFGITYLAQDTNLDKGVAIKEYLPIELAVRERDDSVHPITEDRGRNFQWGLERFISEARTLSQFTHPNIVRVYTVFEENNTAYMIMEYEQGETLQDLLTRRKTLEEPELMSILLPVMGGLDLVHQAGFIHRDIKPANIFIRKDGSPVLLDFGSARQALGEQTRTLTSLVSPGYAPFEQYYSKSDAQGPWTDIYGLGATLYRAVAGIAPMDAVDRSKAIVEGSKDCFVSAVEIGRGRYSVRFLRAIDHALSFKSDERPQSLSEWRSEFRIKEDLAGIKRIQEREAAVTRPGTREVTRDTHPRHRFRYVSLALFLLFVASVGAYFFQQYIKGVFLSSGQETTNTERKEDTVTATAITSAQQEQARQEAEAMADRRRQKEKIQQLLTRANNALAAGRFLQPASDNALAHYLQILDMEPDNAAALAGKREVFDHFLQRAHSLINEQQFTEAERSLLKADIVEADSREVKLARLQLQEKQAEVERITREEAGIQQADAQRRLDEEKQRKAEEETRRQAELALQRQTEERQRLAEDKKRQEEIARLAALEQDRLREAARQRAGEEKQQQYELLIAQAGQAVSNKDKELAVSKYREALALYPGDDTASNGLQQAEHLPDKACLAIIGKWRDAQYIADQLRVSADGRFEQYSAVASYPGRWECTDPAGGRFRFTYEYNNWTADVVFQADGCLQERGRMRKSCWKRKPGDQQSNLKASVTNEPVQTSSTGESRSADVCSRIIGTWKWNDLAGSVSRFYEDGRVVSRNILKSEGTWECIDPEKRLFTFNTWNKKRDIQMNEDYREFRSVGLLGEKLTGKKLSDDPEKQITNTPATTPGSSILGR